MQSYVERQLLYVHESGSRNQLWLKSIPIAIGAFSLCFIPYLHIGFFSHYVWPGKPPIDRSSCTCQCFDTVFRGHYEYPPSNYKHWYFNATFEAYKIWCLLIVGVLIAYESFKYLSNLVIQKKVRWSMFILFLSSVFPHYYSWWNYLNYYNENFFLQWYHQMYFTVTELLASGCVLYLCSTSKTPDTYHLLAVLSISTSHIIIGGLDQFIENIIYRAGYISQVVRDLGLSIPDFLALFVVFIEVRELARTRRTTVRTLFYKEELIFCFIITSILVVIGKSIYW